MEMDAGWVAHKAIPLGVLGGRITGRERMTEHSYASWFAEHVEHVRDCPACQRLQYLEDTRTPSAPENADSPRVVQRNVDLHRP
jgi:hypothetical protein